MKFLNLLSLASLCVSSAVAQIIPPSVNYPSDGIYFILNVQFKQVFNNIRFIPKEGNPIAGYCYVSQKTNEWWSVKAVGSPFDYKVTLRVMSTAEGKPDTGGYAANSNGNLVHSETAQAWTLQPVPGVSSQFLIVDNNTAITQNAATHQLAVNTISQNATNQHWVFIPVNQITDLFAEDPDGGCGVSKPEPMVGLSASSINYHTQHSRSLVFARCSTDTHNPLLDDVLNMAHR
ncbi:uncharacterized protein FOMMEDRAFT_159529 [Fomitiporia mediterranea MF3/22]|uniref:uncharacterized protein n=1 Tax=Fomitiporia mediterranea (strain MF3/22) TaxID=694068 RepID=UPI0004409091|nr:uncharacterized protein FOMMEDRAFT_159529 [Fomitiporia mediterranea MF3/22]EJC99952.1 hypothetical protein FOMMEDRAFT_159529 [Fomitiporia mediterranea MF3/22]